VGILPAGRRAARSLLALGAIRERESEHGLSPTPILALSANVMSCRLDEYARAGMDDLVAKPVDASKLIKAIAAVVDRGATWPA